MQEEYYPRGGTRPKLANKVKPDNLFTSLHKKGSKKKKHSNKKKTDSLQVKEDINLHLTCAELLSYEKILSGMVVLGCVRDISAYTIEVELPGRTYARVEINAISDTLSRSLLEKAENSSDAYIEENVLNILSKLFTRRQFLPIFILDLTETEDNSRRVIGSVNPKHINMQLKYTTFKKNMLLWGSILEKSDHVYIIDAGVKNTRVMLPIKDCDTSTFIEGATSWFIVKESRIQDNTATITVGLPSDKISRSVEDNGNIDQILPGMCVQFQVTKILKDGLEGTYFNDCIGYVNQIYLEEPMDSLEKYRDVSVKAYILYIHPTTKFAYLTLRNIHSPSTPPALPNGHIGSARIVQSIGRGVIISLKKNVLGLVTYKRLVKSLKLKDSSDLTELVKRKFPIGSTHSCRVLDYINMDKMYICTFEQSVLKEKIFNRNDLALGQLVKGVVEGINSSGITVKIGKLVGFITNEHISNSQYSDNLKRNYRIGDAVVARIWDLSGTGIKLTLKPSFIKDDKCLTSYDLAKKNEEYKGMVAKTYDTGALVCFYGGVKGWLKSGNPEKAFKNMFYTGQVITVTASFISNNKLFLSLDPVEKLLNPRKLQIGQFTDGIVESIEENGVFMRTTNGNFQALLPTNHLSINCKLSNTMQTLLDINDKIENLICIGKDNRRILSLREYSYYKDNKFHIPKESQLKPGLLLRCSVKSYDGNELRLTSPIIFFSHDIVVDKKDIMQGEEVDLNFSENQAVIAKITTIHEDCVKATVKLSEVYHYDYNHSVDLLKRYLTDVDKIQQKLMSKGDNLAQYKMGQRINCQIKKINNVGCSVILADGIQGIVAPEHWPNKPLVGSSHEGVILYINFVDKYLGISLRTRTCQNIDKVQGNVSNIEIGQMFYAKTLLIQPEFVLCLLSSKGNRQIAYMPTILHENDFKPNYNYYRNLKTTFKFIVTTIVDNKIIGLEKSLKQRLEAYYKLTLTNVNKRKRNIDVFGANKDGTRKPKRRRVEKNFKSNELSTDDTSSESEAPESDEPEEMEADSTESSESDGEEDDVNLENNVERSESDVEEDNTESQETDLGDNKQSPVCSEKEELPTDSSTDEDDDEEISDKGNEGDDERSKSPKKRVSFSDVVNAYIFTDSSSSKTFVPPSVNNFFDSDDENAEAGVSSEEETVEDDVTTRKKKLTRAEQVELIRQQEEELRKKELEFAEPTGVPQSAEQFDRRLLAEPNSSELWTQYISFHLASTEIDKARVVIKRALQTVDLKAEQDRLNIWIAWMNLENYYGTKETFADVFNEAVRCNDDFTIYMQAIKILSSSSDSSNLDNYIKKARAKFKQDPKMYVEVGKVYYVQKRFAEARKLKDNALRTITNISEHIPLIVKFAIMEFNHGEDYQAEALFETILQSNPKRVDVWCTYVDQLVKKEKIDIARRVLERAVMQKLGVKKMKSLHRKFHEFEKMYGNDETRAEQRKLLENYTKQFGNLDE